MSWGSWVLSVPGAQALLPGVCGYRDLCAVTLLGPSAHPLCCEICVAFSPSPEPAIWLGPQSVSSLWAEKVQLSLFSALKCPAFQDSAAPPWPCLWGSLPVRGNSAFFKTPSLPQGTSSFPVLLLFPFSISTLIPGSLACFPLLSPRGCFVTADPYLDEFLVCLWGEWWSPHLIPLPSSSQSPLPALMLSSNHVRSLEVVFNLFFEQPSDMTLFWLLKFSPIKLSSGHLLGAQNWVMCYRRDGRSLL